MARLSLASRRPSYTFACTPPPLSSLCSLLTCSLQSPSLLPKLLFPLHSSTHGPITSRVARYLCVVTMTSSQAGHPYWPQLSEHLPPAYSAAAAAGMFSGSMHPPYAPISASSYHVPPASVHSSNGQTSGATPEAAYWQHHMHMMMNMQRSQYGGEQHMQQPMHPYMQYAPPADFHAAAAHDFSPSQRTADDNKASKKVPQKAPQRQQIPQRANQAQRQQQQTTTLKNDSNQHHSTRSFTPIHTTRRHPAALRPSRPLPPSVRSP